MSVLARGEITLMHLDIGGRNLIRNSSGKEQKGFFASATITDDYGAFSFSAKNSVYPQHSQVEADSYVISTDEYTQGDIYTWSFDFMCTELTLTDANTLKYVTIGQRVKNTATGTYTNVTRTKFHPDQYELNMWHHLIINVIIPDISDFEYTSSAAIIAVFSAKDTSQVTICLKNVKLEKGNTATAWAPAVEDTTDSIDQAKSSADAANNTANNASDMIESTNEHVQEIQRDLEDTTNQFSENISGLNASVNSLRDDTSSKLEALRQETESKLEAYKASVAKYIQFSEDTGLILGATDKDGSTESPFKTIIDNTSLKFQQDGYTVSEINNRNLNIASATINELEVGNFDFHTRTDGGLSITWKEG